MRTILPSCLLALAPPALAQTYIVDANNGPGTSFTSIQTAVTTVASGSVLLVRPGIYTAFTIANKGITVLADPGAAVALGGWYPATITIGPTQPGQTVVLSDLQVQALLHSPQPLFVDVQNCAGPVFIEGLRSPGTLSMSVTNCAAFALRGTGATPSAYALPRLTLANTNAMIEDSLWYVDPWGFASAPITQQGGSLQLVDSAVHQGTAAPAIALAGGELRLLRGTSIVGGTFAVDGTGSVRVDTGVAVTSPFATALAVASTPMPSVDVAASGTAAQVQLRAPANWFAGLAVALPGQAVLVPGFADAIWLDPATLVWIGAGIVPATQSLALSIALPPVPQAFAVAWQGYTWDPANGILISNPSPSVIR